MDEANENGRSCWSGCLVCLTATWGLVKMITCCRCRSLAHLVCPDRAAVERDPEETSGVVSDVETLTPSPSPRPRQTRVRFQSIVEVFLLILGRRRSGTETATVERRVERIAEESDRPRNVTYNKDAQEQVEALQWLM